MKSLDSLSRRDFLNNCLVGLAGLTIYQNLSKPAYASRGQLNSEIAEIFSNQEEVYYKFFGKLGKESVITTITKDKDRAYLRLIRKTSKGFLKSINYNILLKDTCETGWGNIDSAVLSFKDNTDRERKESSEATIEFSENSKNEGLIKPLNEVYAFIGKNFITSKKGLYNQDITFVDKLLMSLFDDYRIPLPIAEVIKDSKKQEEGERGEVDLKGVVVNGLKIGTKVGRPR